MRHENHAVNMAGAVNVFRASRFAQPTTFAAWAGPSFSRR
jgi:hypothetical protein